MAPAATPTATAAVDTFAVDSGCVFAFLHAPDWPFYVLYMGMRAFQTRQGPLSRCPLYKCALDVRMRAKLLLLLLLHASLSPAVFLAFLGATTVLKSN